MKNRTLAMVLASAVLVASLIGCGGPAKEEGTAAQPEEQTAARETAQEQEAQAPAGEAVEAESEKSEKNVPSDDPYEHFVTTETDGCASFDQIIEKLEAGKSYAKAEMGTGEVLLVSGETFEDPDGGMEALSAEVFSMGSDGEAVYLGYAESSGTAYPLAVAEGKLFAGGNHFMSKYKVADGALVTDQEAYVKYDTEGKATFFCGEDGAEPSDSDQARAEGVLDTLYEEYGSAQVLIFEPAGK